MTARRLTLLPLLLALTACPQALPSDGAKLTKLEASPQLLWLEPGGTAAVTISTGTTGVESSVNVSGLPDGVTTPPLKLTASSGSQNLALSASSSAPESDLKTVTVSAGSAKVSLQVGVRKPVPTDPNGPDIVLSRVEWGQGVLKPDLKLVANKAALMRVFVTASKASLAAKVRASFSRNGTNLGSLELTGPATVPTSEDPSSLTQTYNTTVPATWVAAGLQVQVQADDGNLVLERDERNNASSIAPTVVQAGVLRVTGIPVVVAGKTGSVPDLAAGVAATWPVQGVEIRKRAAYTYAGTGSTCKATLSPDWSCLLAELDKLRDLDGKGQSDEYYYGFVAGVKTGTIGIGYVGWPVSAGTDDPSLALYTMRHELGHNFGLYHAPCGTTSGLEPALSASNPNGYPTTDASLTTFGYDLSTSTLIAKTGNKDVMGYCRPAWVSSYMYDKAQTFLTTPAAAMVPQASEALEPVLLVSGSVYNGQVSIDPIVRATGRVSTPSEGSFTAVLETSTGSISVPFNPRQTAHGEAAPWSFTVPDTGDLKSLEVRFAGATLARKAAGIRTQSTLDAHLEVQETGGVLNVRWDPRAYGTASVAHLTANGERTTLALRLGGGTASLPLVGLPAGGSFEVSLGDGLGGISQRFQR